jgi:hypothetical protein
MSWLLLSAVMFPAIVAYGILYRQAFSVPYQDDYKAILGFAIDYAHLPSSTTKVVSIATRQHNEYKLGFEQSIVASELELTRHLDFGFLIALGDLFLLPIAYLLWRTFQSTEPDLNLRLLAFVPISLVFFSLSYWENLNWAMTGLQNTPVIFFGLLTLYLLAAAKSSQPTLARFLLACLSALLAAFTSANAFLLGPVGLLILLPRRAYGRSLMWCATFMLPLGCYLYHYVPSVHPMYRAYYITRPLFFLAFFRLCDSIPLARGPTGLDDPEHCLARVCQSFLSHKSSSVLSRCMDCGQRSISRMGAGSSRFHDRLPLQHLLRIDADLLLFISPEVFT